jgi:hypothetical protein
MPRMSNFEGEENRFWYCIWRLILILAINAIWACTVYWSIDRYYQGHTIITSPQTVTKTQ